MQNSYQAIETVMSNLASDAGGIAKSWGTGLMPFTPTDAIMSSLTNIDIDSLIDTGMLRVPYVVVKRAGQSLPPKEYTETRIVRGARLTGYVNVPKLRSLIAQGCTLLFSHVEHWHTAVAQICASLRQGLEARSGATIFYTPAGHRGLVPHRDTSHVISIQMSGNKNWLIESSVPPSFDPNIPVNPEALSEGTPFELVEGAGLYLPPGIAHVAATTENVSTHLSIWVIEPTISELVYAAALKISSTFPANAFAPPPGAARLQWAEETLAKINQRMASIDPGAVLVDLARAMQGDNEPDGSTAER
jgi:hypothetical protein